MEKKKTCSKCRETKQLTGFDRNKSQKDGFCNQCKDCYRVYRKVNKDKIKATSKIWKKNNEDKQKEKSKAYYQANREEILAYQKKWREDNKDEIKLKDKARYQKKKNSIKNYRKQKKETINAYKRKKRMEDPMFKLKENIRSRVYNSIKRKSKKTEEIIGCSYEQLYLHLNYNNFNNPSHDHIIPLSWANTDEELYALARWENLQGMECNENISKGNYFCKKHKADNVVKIHPNPEVIKTILNRVKILDDLYII